MSYDFPNKWWLTYDPTKSSEPTRVIEKKSRFPLRMTADFGRGRIVVELVAPMKGKIVESDDPEYAVDFWANSWLESEFTILKG